MIFVLSIEVRDVVVNVRQVFSWYFFLNLGMS